MRRSSLKMLAAVCFGIGVLGCANRREMLDQEMAAGKKQGMAIREYMDRNAISNGAGATQTDAERMLAEFNRHQPRLSPPAGELEDR